MEEIEKFVLSMEEKVTELEAQMQENVKALNAKMNAIKALIKEEKINVDNAKNGIEGRIWKVGDVLLSDGAVVNADDVYDMTKAEIKKAEGIVCAVKKEGKIAYIIDAMQAVKPLSKQNLENIEEYEKELGKNLSKFKDDWEVPTFGNLVKIAENLQTINNILEIFGVPKIRGNESYLTREKYDINEPKVKWAILNELTKNERHEGWSDHGNTIPVREVFN